MFSFSKTKLNVRLTSTSFYDDENNKRKKNYIYNYESDSNFNNIQKQQILQNNDKLDNETLYTLIWFNCEDCKNLLRDVKNERKKYYISMEVITSLIKMMKQILLYFIKMMI